MKRLMVGLLATLPLDVLAAEPVAQAAAAAPASLGGQLTQLVLGLLLVVGLIFVLAFTHPSALLQLPAERCSVESGLLGG